MEEETNSNDFRELDVVNIFPPEGLITVEAFSRLLKNVSYKTCLRNLIGNNIPVLEYSKGKYLVSLTAIADRLRFTPSPV